jgi:hypothetical protein
MARPVQKDPIMSKKSLLTILSLAAATALAGCAEKDAAPAKTAQTDRGAPGAPASDGDQAAARDRGGNRPPMPRHLGSGADDDQADDHRWGSGDRPSREEMEARRDERMKEMLDKFDADHDGQLSDTERTAAHQARVADMMTRVDTDHDGKLSQAEMDAMPMRGRGGRGPDFATLDVDKDGFVTPAEMAAARPPRPFRDRGPDDRGPADPAPSK